jgi:hypothetical protein
MSLYIQVSLLLLSVDEKTLTQRALGISPRQQIGFKGYER